MLFVRFNNTESIVRENADLQVLGLLTSNYNYVRDNKTCFGYLKCN